MHCSVQIMQLNLGVGATSGKSSLHVAVLVGPFGTALSAVRGTMVVPSSTGCSLQGEESGHSTVYTVRLETATDRGAGMDDLNSGVMICLLGKTDALMHRISQIPDAVSSEDVMDEVCEVCVCCVYVASPTDYASKLLPHCW